jgi:cytochrome P450
MLFLDPPQHSRLRKLLNKEFTPNMIQRMRPRIQQVVNSLLDELAGKSEMEFMTEFANPLPVRVKSHSAHYLSGPQIYGCSMMFRRGDRI